MPAEGPLRHGHDAGFRLIETMRWEPGTGLVRRDLHFSRLAGSARELGFAFSQQAVDTRIRAALRGANGAMRVRVVLERDGQATVEAKPFAALPAARPWRLGIAAIRLDSTDPLLRHKTSKPGFAFVSFAIAGLHGFVLAGLALDLVPEALKTALSL